MELQTKVDIPVSTWKLKPQDRLLFVGSCFADNLGHRFTEEHFRAVVNPFGVMYNPVSIQHTVQRWLSQAEEDAFVPDVAIFTLGTNHVYIEKSTGEIVDNCQKRPQCLFEERELTVAECVDALQQAVALLQEKNQEIRIIFTVSPIRYRKYGYHGSMLSKATLLLAVNQVITEAAGKEERGKQTALHYFPAYEIVNDELRDYRFYAPDMLHPSAQAVDYIFERFCQTYFGSSCYDFLAEWRPIREALGHKPFKPDSEEYRLFLQKTKERQSFFEEKWGI